MLASSACPGTETRILARGKAGRFLKGHMGKILKDSTAAALQRLMRSSDLTTSHRRIPVNDFNQIPEAYKPWALFQITPGSTATQIKIGIGAITRGGTVYTCAAMTSSITIVASGQIVAWKFDPSTNTLTVDPTVYMTMPSASDGCDFGPLYSFNLLGDAPNQFSFLKTDYIRGLGFPAIYS